MRLEKGLYLGIWLFVIAFPASAQIKEPPILVHPHSDLSIEWEIDQTKDGDKAHNHMWDRSFGGFSDFAHPPYSAMLCWNNGEVFVDVSGAFEKGHCYVEHILNSVTYSFEGTGWTNNRKNAVRYAADEWDELASLFTGIFPHGQNGYRVGLALEEVASGGNIELRWVSSVVGGAAETTDDPSDRTKMYINFDNSYSWDPTTSPAQEDDTKYHLLTAALHEFGHALGLTHQLDIGDLMINQAIPAPLPNNQRHTHYEVEEHAASGIYDLYGQPPPPPGQPTTALLWWSHCIDDLNSFTSTWDSTNLSPGDYFEVEYKTGGGWNPWYEGAASCNPKNTSYSSLDVRIRVVDIFGQASAWVLLFALGNCGGPAF